LASPKQPYLKRGINEILHDDVSRDEREPGMHERITMIQRPRRGNPPIMTRVLIDGFWLMRPHEPAKQPVTLPEQPGNEASAGKTPIIDGIIYGMVQNHRAKPFKENNPYRDMKGDFPPTRRLVVRTKPDPSVDKEVYWQGHGHGQSVVEMPVKEGGIVMEVRLDQRAVDDVGREADEENGIAPITKSAA